MNHVCKADPIKRFDLLRSPLLVPGVGIWLIACACLFACTATSSVDEHAVTRTSELTRPATDAGIQSLFDQIAEQNGLMCQRCDPPSLGRTYWSTAGPLVRLDLSFDADPPQRLYFNVFTLAVHGLSDADRQRVDRVAQAVGAALNNAFPGREVRTWAAPQSRRFRIDLRLGPVTPKGPGDTLSDVGDYGRATVIMNEVAHRYGLRGSDGGYFLDAVLPRLKMVALDISADGERTVWIDAWPEQFARQQALADELLRRFQRAFGEERVVRRDDGQ